MSLFQRISELPAQVQHQVQRLLHHPHRPTAPARGTHTSNASTFPILHPQQAPQFAGLPQRPAQPPSGAMPFADPRAMAQGHAHRPASGPFAPPGAVLSLGPAVSHIPRQPYTAGQQYGFEVLRQRAGQANQQFVGEVQQAEAQFGSRVSFRPVVENGVLVGYLAAGPSARRSRGERGTNAAPALMVAGNGRISASRPQVEAAGPVAVLRTGPDAAGMMELAQAVAGQRVPLQQAALPSAPGQPVPNLQLAGGALSPVATAEMLASGQARGVEVFLPVPAAEVHLSTLWRHLAGQHSGIVYAHP